MKLKARKITLIIATGLLTFLGAFAADEEDGEMHILPVTRPGEQGGGIRQLQKIKVINNVEDYTVDLMVGPEVKGARQEAIKKEKIVAIKGPFKTIQLVIKKGSTIIGDSGEIEMSSIDRKRWTESLKSKLSEKLKNVRINLKDENEVLVITIDKK